MSALPPKAAIGDAMRNIRFVPNADSCTAAILSLFDHLVGAAEQRGRQVEPERLSGLHVDHQFVLRWCLYRQVGGLLTLEDAIDVAGRVAVLVENIWSI